MSEGAARQHDTAEGRMLSDENAQTADVTMHLVPTRIGSSVVDAGSDNDDAVSHTYQMQLTVALALSDPLIMDRRRAG